MPAQKYGMIYKDLKRGIEEGLYPAESCIPTEYTLVDRYGCSRNTIRRAIQQLQELGYVQSIHGKGVVVIYRKELFNQDRDRFESAAEYYRRLGKTATYRVLELKHYRAGDREVEMGFREGMDMCLIRRVRYIDDIPSAIEIAHFSEKMVKGVTEELAEHSIYEYIRKEVGEKLLSSMRSVSIELASEEDLKYLDPSPCNCLGIITGRSYDSNGTLVEFSQSRSIPKFFSMNTIAVDRKLPL